MHIELQTFQTTAAPATGAIATALTGDSATIRNGRGKISIIAAWASPNTNRITTQMVYPSGHDTTRGYRVEVGPGPITSVTNAGALTIPLGAELIVQPQETVVTTNFAAAVAGDVDSTSYLVHYADFPGIDARLMTATEVASRTEKMTTIVCNIPDAGVGVYSEEVITVDSDLLRANRDYAVLGFTAAFAAHSFTFFSPDNGNTRTGCPGNLRPEITAQWFMLLSRLIGGKAVPIFNSGNKGQVRLGFVGDENAGARLITAHLALLR